MEESKGIGKGRGNKKKEKICRKNKVNESKREWKLKEIKEKQEK